MTSAAAPNRQNQRLAEEINALENNPLPFLKNLNLDDATGLNVVTGTMIGPEGSDYATGHFEFWIEFPKAYPFQPPIFRFKTKICHPNVIIEKGNNGVACHEEFLVQWTPRIKLAQLLTEMYKLLKQPNYELPVDNILVDGSPVSDDTPSAASSDPPAIQDTPSTDGASSAPSWDPPATKDRKTARLWTRLYAQPKN